MRNLVTCLCLLATPLQAQTLDEAHDLWLTGQDDVTALTQFADLAAEGDVSAQVWLGRIAVLPHTWPAELQDMGRRARNAILKAPGGLSGRSWITVASDVSRLAWAIDAAARIDDRPHATMILLDNGETTLASDTIQRLIQDNEWAAAITAIEHPNATARMKSHLPKFRAVLHYLRTGQELPALFDPMPVDPVVSLADAHQNPQLVAKQGAHLRQSSLFPELDAMLALCAPCPNTDACLGAIWLGSDPAFLAAMSTPLESVVTSAAYQASPRYLQDLRAHLRGFERAIGFSRIAQLDACAATQISE